MLDFKYTLDSDLYIRIQMLILCFRGCMLSKFIFTRCRLVRLTRVILHDPTITCQALGLPKQIHREAPQTPNPNTKNRWVIQSTHVTNALSHSPRLSKIPPTQAVADTQSEDVGSLT